MSLLSDPNFPTSAFSGWPWNEETNPAIYNASIDWPTISIVTPSYNQGKYIEETIRSVLLQNYPNLEYIIIDGGSNDETVAILKKYEPWITLWISEPDNGQSAAINKGIQKCTGEIFNWLNSDDFYSPGALIEIAKAFKKDHALLAVSSYEKHFGDGRNSYIYHGTTFKETLPETIEFCEVAQPSTFFKLKAVKEVGGVSEDLHFIMDGEMWIKLLLINGQDRFYKIEKPLLNFRFHENSKTVSNAEENNFLFERCSIIADLQRSVGVPEKITKYYVNEIYQSPKVYDLNRIWQFNNSVISKKKLRVYFIQKYVMKQFRRGNKKNAGWGIIQLIKNRAVDFFLLKSVLKLAINKKY